jgi:Flp pilus assembly protein TadG
MTASWSPLPEGDGGCPEAGVADLAIVFPVFVIMLLLIAGFGRIAYSHQLVDQAAEAGARAAALDNRSADAQTDGTAAATAALASAGVACQQPVIDVDVSQFKPGGVVAVTVRCTADLSSLALSGLPGSMTLTGAARAALESNRDYGHG